MHDHGLTIEETRVGRKKVIVVPGDREEVGLVEGQRVRIRAENGKALIEPVRYALWLALHGRKIG